MLNNKGFVHFLVLLIVGISAAILFTQKDKLFSKQVFQPSTAIGVGDTSPIGIGSTSPSSSSTPTPSPSPTPDTIAPIVSITGPFSNANPTVKKNTTVNITASASDASGIAKVDIYVSNSLICSTTVSPYSCPWAVPNKPNAKYYVFAKATDKAGNIGTSSVIQVTATAK